MNHLKDNIKYYRELAKMTQKELADKLGVTKNNIGHWEKGRTEPDIDTLLAMCAIFSITLDELVSQ